MTKNSQQSTKVEGKGAELIWSQTYSSLLHSWCSLASYGPSQVAQMIKNVPATQETRVRSLGWEGPLEK